MLTREDHGRVVGYLTIHPGTRVTEHYECAAWYRTHEFQPGVYPVTLNIAKRHTFNGERTLEVDWDCYLAALDVPTTVVAAYLGTLWGGVAVGPDRSGPREIGRASTYPAHVAYGFNLADLNARLASLPNFVLA